MSLSLRGAFLRTSQAVLTFTTALQAECSGAQAAHERHRTVPGRSFVHRWHAWRAASRRRVERVVRTVFFSVTLCLRGHIRHRIHEARY